MRSGSYLLYFAVFWLIVAGFFLLRDVFWTNALKQRFNPPQIWLFVVVALALSIWNAMRWYSRQRAKNEPTDWNPFDKPPKVR